MTIARFGLISCLRAADEKSIITETYLIRDFLFIDKLNSSMFFLVFNFRSVSFKYISFLSVSNSKRVFSLSL